MDLTNLHAQSVGQLEKALIDEDGATAAEIALDGSITDLEMLWIVCGALKQDLGTDSAEFLALAINKENEAAIVDARLYAPSMIKMARAGEQAVCLTLSRMERWWAITLIAICHSQTLNFANAIQPQLEAIHADPDCISHV